MAGIESEAHRYPIDAHELRRLPFIPDVPIAGLFEQRLRANCGRNGFDPITGFMNNVSMMPACQAAPTFS